MSARDPSGPSGRRTPSLPLADASTLASPHIHRYISSSTLASSSSPTNLLPSSIGTRSTPSSWGRRTHTPTRSGGFLLGSSSTGSSSGGRFLSDYERERTSREPGAGHGKERIRQGHYYHEPGPPYTGVQGGTGVEEGNTSGSATSTPDTDPARIVSLALGLSEARRRGTNARSVSSIKRLRDIADEREGSNDSWLGAGLGIVPQTGTHVNFVNTGGRGHVSSPDSSFLVGGNMWSPDTGPIGIGGRQPSPSTPSSPPPPAGGVSGRQTFYPISPLPIPPPANPYQRLQQKRSFLGQQQQLKEFREQYHPTEATILRAQKAKQQLELSALYKKLLTIWPAREATVGGGGHTYNTLGKGDGSAGLSSRERVYNPLMAIRNKRFRNREKIKMELSSWDDPGAVEQWIEDVAVAIQEHVADRKAGLPQLPPPPHPTGGADERKRARMDWVISPQELLADFYWVEKPERTGLGQTQQAGWRPEEQKKQEKQRESHLSLKGLTEREDSRARSSSQNRKRTRLDLGNEEGGDEIIVRNAEDSGKKRARPMVALPSGTHFDDENPGYQSAYSSEEESSHGSESGDDYDEAMSEMEADSDIDQKTKKKHSKRRALGNFITSAKPGRGKRGAKKKRISDTYIEDPEERRRKQEQEEMEWMAEVGDGPPGFRRSHSTDKDIDPTVVLNKSTGVRKTGTEISLQPRLSGSRSSLDRPNTTGVPTSRRSLDFSEIVVPSIAISLSPPRIASRGEDGDADLRGRAKRKEDIGSTKDEKGKTSPTKRLLEKRKESLGWDRDMGDGGGHGEILGIDVGGKGKDKEASRMDRVRNRVGKIRSEVAKVEDFIRRRDGEKGGSALSSPTGSIFAEAHSMGYRSDDNQARLTRENTPSGSEAGDEGRDSKAPGGRESLEVPDVRLSVGPSRHRGHHSGSVRPMVSSPAGVGIGDDRWDFSSDDDLGRGKKPSYSIKFGASGSHASRDPSPAKALNIQSIGDKDGRARGEKTTPRGLGLRKNKALVVVGGDPGASIATANRQELMRARAYLLASGVVARGITAKRSRNTVLGGVSHNNHGKGIVVLAKQQIYSAAAISHEITDTERAFAAKSETFTHSTVVELKRLVNGIKEEVEGVLAPILGEVADGADELNGELTTKCTLAVKAVNDDLSNVMRRKRRRFRWVRRVGYVMLEWVVLGVMWWVWLVVVAVRILRVTLTGVVRGVRWILWI